MVMRLFSLKSAAAATAAAAAIARCRGNSGGYSSNPAPPTAFTWLKADTAPAGWKLATTRSGARVAYPRGWRPIRTDPGTASAAPRGRRGYFAGYLNATPQQGAETLANCRRSRVPHGAAEAEHPGGLVAAATGLHLGNG